jgi:hypothetical protein
MTPDCQTFWGVGKETRIQLETTSLIKLLVYNPRSPNQCGTVLALASFRLTSEVTEERVKRGEEQKKLSGTFPQ